MQGPFVNPPGFFTIATFRLSLSSSGKLCYNRLSLYRYGNEGGRFRMRPIVLASQSPRRRELLNLYGLPFVVEPSLADEDGVTGTGAERVQTLARIKCEEVARRHTGCYVLAADTLVCVDGAVLGKPKDAADARRMLRMLSGRTHEVHTGVCLCLPDGGLLCGVDTTRVTFLPMDDSAIERYIATDEPFDKAGAYAIQGVAGIFIQSIEGSFSNVIGLPLALVTRFFTQAGLCVPARPAGV